MKPEAMRIINAFGLKPIHIATIRGQKGNVSMLVNAGTNVNEQTRHGIAPLMLGALFGHIDIVALLIKNGAERSIQDAEQRTAKEVSRFVFSFFSFFLAYVFACLPCFRIYTNKY